MSIRQPAAKGKDFAAERQHLRRLAWQCRELIDELDRRYPAVTPELDTTERVLWSSIGARKLVEFLLQMRREGEADAGGAFAVLPTSQILPHSL